MRLNNKISIKGDTLTIFKEGMFNPMKGGANLGAIANAIYKELDQMNSRDDTDKTRLVKQAVETLNLSAADEKEIFYLLFQKDADERYDDMSRYDEAINQYLEEGEDEIDFDDENFSDPMIDDPDSMNELSTYNNNPVTSEYNGKTITWDDYEVVERNVDGGGYTDAIMLMGSDEDGNEYTCEGSTTQGDVDEWDDSTIEMVNSINEANTLPIIKSVTYFGGGNYTVTLDDGYKILISGGNLEGIYGGDAEDVNSFVGQEWD